MAAFVDRLVVERHAAALAAVDQLRSEDPTATVDELADRLIRRTARDLAVAGAVSGGAAAAPWAGVVTVAASAGADATFGVGRLAEMILGLGALYGFDHASPDERARWVRAALGLSEGAAVGLTGVAARAGSRGGARLLARLPTSPVASPVGGWGGRVLGRWTARRGPWSLAALVPYGIGAGVGAAGNAVLARSVGRAAKQFFAAGATIDREPAIVEDVTEVEVELLDAEFAAEASVSPAAAEDRPSPDDVVDAVVVRTDPPSARPGATGDGR